MERSAVTREHSTRVVHAARMMVDLRPLCFEPSIGATAQAGCMEAFAINVRGLAAFLRNATPANENRNIIAADYLGDDWPKAPDEVGRLIGWASGAAAHLSWGLADPGEPTPARFREIAGLVVGELQRFATALEIDSHPEAEFFGDNMRVHVVPNV